MSSTRVTAEIGVEIAHSLFSQTKTTAASSTAARLNASCRIPWFAAPSPKKQTVTPSFALQAQAVGRADRDRRRARDDRVRSEHALVDRRDVHAAAVPAAVAVFAPEDLGHHPSEIEALRDAVPVPAVGARDQIVGAEARARRRPRSLPCRRRSAPGPWIRPSSNSSPARVSKQRIRHICRSRCSSVSARDDRRRPLLPSSLAGPGLLGDRSHHLADADLVTGRRVDRLEHTRYRGDDLLRDLVGLDLERGPRRPRRRSPSRLNHGTIVAYSISARRSSVTSVIGGLLLDGLARPTPKCADPHAASIQLIMRRSMDYR